MRPAVAVLLLLTCFWISVATSAGEEPTGPGGFGGVGLQVVPTIEGDLVILRVVAGTPADRQGLRPGDLIFRVDDFVLKGSDFGKVVSEHLWGPVGSQTTLYVRRPGQAGERKVLLQRTPMDPKLTVTPAAKMPVPHQTGQDR